MKTADDPTNAADPIALLVTEDDIDTNRLGEMNDVLVTALRSGSPRDEYLKNEPDGFKPTEVEWERMFQNYRHSGAPSKPSTPRFNQPKNVREFAAQANRVATAILNNEIDLDTARAYSAVARTVAQAVTAQTVHARFLKTAPDLDFPEEEA